MEKEFAEYLLREGAKNYDIIAEDYARTRRYNSQDLIELAELAKPGQKVLDLGCANGRMFELFAPRGIEYHGVDISPRLIEIAKKLYPAGHFRVADALDLPFADSSFDRVYYISVLHHIPSKEFRAKTFSEIARVLKPQGILVLRVWDLLRIEKGLNLLLKYTFLKMLGRTRLDFCDLMMPWKDFSGKQKGERYFHCFSGGELKEMSKEAGLGVKRIWRGGSGRLANIYMTAQKV